MKATILLLFLCACAQPRAPAQASAPAKTQRHPLFLKVESNLRIADLDLVRFSNIYFAAQPSLDTIEALAAEGFKTIISLREKNEYDAEAQAQKSIELGLNYDIVPLAKDAELSDEFLDAVSQKVMTHRKEGKILIHCGSGNRAGLWAGGHFFKDHGLSPKQSERMAQELGMKNSALPKLRRYLNGKNKAP